MKVLSASGALLGLLTGLSFVLDPVVEAGGRLSAHLDLALGHHRYIPFGHGSPLTPHWHRVMQERYGVEVRTHWFEQFDAILDVWPDFAYILEPYLEGYDSVSLNAANRKFGKDVSIAPLHEAAAGYGAHPPPPR